MPSEALSELAERLDVPVEAWGLRLAISIGVVVALVLVRWAVVGLVERQVDDPGLRYRCRKATSYTPWPSACCRSAACASAELTPCWRSSG